MVFSLIALESCDKNVIDQYLLFRDGVSFNFIPYVALEILG